ncbi:effector-associated constant component EACC1 [Nocardia nova]
MTEGNPELMIRADGGQDELLALLDWFGHDEALRGRVRPVSAPTCRGHMNAGVDEALGVALGAGGIASALAKSLTAWVTHRRSDVKLTLTRNDGTRLEIDAARVDSPQVLRELRDLLDPPSIER